MAIKSKKNQIKNVSERNENAGQWDEFTELIKEKKEYVDFTSTYNLDDDNIIMVF